MRVRSYNAATCWFANLAECGEGRCQPQGDGWRRRALVALHHIHRVEGPPGAVTNLWTSKFLFFFFSATIDDP